MSDTDTLIERLAASGAAPRGHALSRFVLPLGLVMALCALGAGAALDGAFVPARQDGFGAIMVKWGFSLALLVMSSAVLWISGQPGRRGDGAFPALAIPFVLVIVLLLVDLALGGRDFPGGSWRQCLLAMAVMSPIGFAGAIMAARWLAPTRLRRAGLVAGLFGGSVAMTAYAPFCPEHGMAYMAVFYCLPILAMAGLGWMLGPRLLHW